MTPPASPLDPKVCRLYGQLLDVSGRPLPHRTISFDVESSFAPPIMGTAFVSGQKITALSGSDGVFYVDLFRKMLVSVQTPTSPSRTAAFKVPDTDLAPLTDYLYPYPREVVLYRVDTVEVLEDNEGVPVGTEIATAVRWSDGALEGVLWPIRVNGVEQDPPVELTDPSTELQPILQCDWEWKDRTLSDAIPYRIYPEADFEIVVPDPITVTTS